MDADATPPFTASATLVPLTGAFTTWVSPALVDARLPASPAYAAAIPWLPVVSALVEQDADRALPLPVRLIALQPASATPLSVNLTEPVGAVPLTVAVNVTIAPVSDGFGVAVTDVVDDAQEGTVVAVAVLE